MKVGLFAINLGPCAEPRTAEKAARDAEQAGFESLWTGEHVVLPDPRVPPSPLPAATPILDPAISLTFLAGCTRTIRLGTGIIILPQRNPLVLAKELASLDVVSGGRLIFGVGIGYLKPEFDALGVPFEDKGARAEEYLRAILALWTEERPSFAGRFVSFGAVQAYPRPLQKPRPEIVFGGHTPAAYRRAARLAEGWFGFALDVERSAECIAGLKRACEAIDRRIEDLEISVTPALPAGATRAEIAEVSRRLRDLGVRRLVFYPAGAGDEAGILRFIECVSSAVVAKL